MRQHQISQLPQVIISYSASPNISLTLAPPQLLCYITIKVGDIVNLFSKLFKKNASIPSKPPFSKIVEMMYDRSLSFSEDLQAIKVLYNEEKTKRFILLRSFSGYYKYTYEELCVLDAKEWMYICNQKDAVPAYWNPKDRSFAYSFFGTEEEALTMLMQEAEYKKYFSKNKIF